MRWPNHILNINAGMNRYTSEVYEAVQSEFVPLYHEFLKALVLVQNPKTNLNYIYKVKTRTTAMRQARERSKGQLILISFFATSFLKDCIKTPFPKWLQQSGERMFLLVKKEK